MGRFSKMQTPEQQYLSRGAAVKDTQTRKQAGARADQLTQQAHKARQEAEKAQMGVDVYGRQGRDYSDPAKADRAAKDRDKHLSKAARLQAEADRQAQIAKPAEKPKKKSWW